MIVPRVVNVLYGLDEAANALLGGSPRETISGTVGRAAAAGAWWAVHIALPLINAIMFDPNHCQNTAKIEEARRVADKGLD